MTRPWLVAIDLQRVFAEVPSPWASSGFDAAADGIERLLPAFAGRTLFTRYVAPAQPHGAWVPYFEAWPFARVPADDPMYEIVPRFAAAARAARVETRETFGKWDPQLHAAIDGVDEIVLTGVSTDCCVIATALAAADHGIRVTVVADACAGASPEDHQRALDAMALFTPLIELATVDEVLRG